MSGCHIVRVRVPLDFILLSGNNCNHILMLEDSSLVCLDISIASKKKDWSEEVWASAKVKPCPNSASLMMVPLPILAGPLKFKMLKKMVLWMVKKKWYEAIMYYQNDAAPHGEANDSTCGWLIPGFLKITSKRNTNSVIGCMWFVFNMMVPELKLLKWENIFNDIINKR